jgi:hypothetical protein
MYKLLISGMIFSGALYLYTKKNTDSSKIQEFDMIIGPGGYYGFYILGVCHYLRNTYDLSNVKMIGFSAGSMTIIFMSLPVTIINEYLRLLFNHKITSDIALLAENIFNHMKKTIKFNELDLTNKYVGLTTSSYTLYVHHTFISTNDLVNCCQASSFVPMVTKKTPLYYYNGNAYFDGALSYWRLRQFCKKKCLIVTYRMFGRYKTVSSTGLTYTPSMSIYNMYLLGYRDAMTNKPYLDTFFNLKP